MKVIIETRPKVVVISNSGISLNSLVILIINICHNCSLKIIKCSELIFILIKYLFLRLPN